LCRQLEQQGKAGALVDAAAMVRAVENHFGAIRPLLLAEMGQPA
jgi:hypothetical protein